MKRLVFCILFISSISFGCAQSHFNIPADNFAEKVKNLGLAPILIDSESDIIHPQKDLLIPLISDLNLKYEPLLMRKLQNSGNYYTVTMQTDDAKQLFSSILTRREKRDDAGIQYNKYFWKQEEIEAYLKKNRLDAVMIIVVSGLTKNSKIYSNNLMTSLESNYNFLTMTAQIVGSNGELLWEYPNFRGRILPYYPLVNLQYPDFSESEANISNTTSLRFKSIDGVRRTLEQKKSDIIFRETQEPEVYGRLFDQMTSLLTNPLSIKSRSVDTVANKLPVTEIQQDKVLSTSDKQSLTDSSSLPKVIPTTASTVDLTDAPKLTTPKNSFETPALTDNVPIEVVPATTVTP